MKVEKKKKKTFDNNSQVPAVFYFSLKQKNKIK